MKLSEVIRMLGAVVIKHGDLDFGVDEELAPEGLKPVVTADGKLLLTTPRRLELYWEALKNQESEDE